MLTPHWLVAVALALGTLGAALGEDAHQYHFELPATDTGYHVAVKSYLDDLDPNAAPSAESLSERDLATFATPGEYEPLTFVIYAVDDLEQVNVELTELRCGEAVIPRENLELRTVVRAPQKRAYFAPPEDCSIMSRFLPAFESFDLPAGHFREIWITIHVPEDAPPGDYQGTVTVAPAGRAPTDLTLSLRVLGFKLLDPPHKKFGLYFRLGRFLKPEVRERTMNELADLREHGITILFPSLHVRCSQDDEGNVGFDYTQIEQGLALMREAGFQGPVFIGTGLPSLQKLLELEDAALETDESFLALAKQSIEGLKAVAGEFAEFDFVLTHMDEVFNQGRLPRYIALTKAARQVPGFRFYITFHTVNERADEMRREVDPYVDIRGHHGYTFDWWLARGGTCEGYAQELRDSGDQGTFYYNPNRIWHTTEWQRVINGLYMWVNPFMARLDWVPQPSAADPFADPIKADSAFVYVSPTDGVTPLPTRLWEGWREGIDDLRYLYTLERAIAEREGDKPQQAAAARVWLEELRASIPAPQGLEINTSGCRATDDENGSPFINAIAQQFSSEDYQRIRSEAAEHIAALTE
jgi:hypothetical protein